jgi:lycopene cyclase domain-containing protein
MFGHFTYLAFELGWALPVVTLHWLVGWRRLLPRLRLLVLATALPTIYLSLADSLALHAGIWTLHSDRIVGWHVGNVPIEEIVFFLVSNLIVVQSVLLLKSD